MKAGSYASYIAWLRLSAVNIELMTHFIRRCLMFSARSTRWHPCLSRPSAVTIGYGVGLLRTGVDVFRPSLALGYGSGVIAELSWQKVRASSNDKHLIRVETIG
jgi:hypothetical protein